MRTIQLTKESRKNILEDLLKRSPNQYVQYTERVEEILREVRERGDAAVFDYTKRFDKAELTRDTIRVTEEEIAEAEIQKVVRRMAEELPEKYRLVVYLYYTREQKIEEIASMLHIPKGTVKSRLHKARSMIRDRMEAEGYEIS